VVPVASKASVIALRCLRRPPSTAVPDLVVTSPSHHLLVSNKAHGRALLVERFPVPSNSGRRAPHVDGDLSVFVGVAAEGQAR